MQIDQNEMIMTAYIPDVFSFYTHAAGYRYLYWHMGMFFCTCDNHKSLVFIYCKSVCVCLPVCLSLFPKPTN